MKTKIAFASVIGIGLAALFLGGVLTIAGCSGPPIGSDQWRKNIFASAPNAPQPTPVAVRP